MRVTSLRENNNWVLVTNPINYRLSGWIQKEAIIRTTKEIAVSHKTDSIQVLMPNAPRLIALAIPLLRKLDQEVRHHRMDRPVFCGVMDTGQKYNRSSGDSYPRAEPSGRASARTGMGYLDLNFQMTCI